MNRYNGLFACEKCGARIVRLRLVAWLLGRESYRCPRCGSICTICVEKYARPMPTCKYCGAVVKKE